jgi:hypothetical protein
MISGDDSDHFGELLTELREIRLTQSTFALIALARDRPTFPAAFA